MHIPPPVNEAEQQILTDIQRRTGLSFRRIGGVDTGDKAIAEVVLPVLAEWVPVVPNQNLRHAIYGRFITVHANPYMDSLVGWAKKETYALAVDTLIQAIASAAKSTDAERLLKVTDELPKSNFHYFLLARLAKFPAVATEIKDKLVEALGSTDLRAYEVGSIAGVDDPRIRKWFESRVDAPDKQLRALARKVVNRGKQLQPGIIYAAAPPDRGGELFSTEADIDEVPTVLKALVEDLRLKIPASVRIADFLSRLDQDRWAVATIRTERGEPTSIWFRLEDFDTVEICVVRGWPSSLQGGATDSSSA
jgi:hypothetical protein